MKFLCHLIIFLLPTYLLYPQSKLDEAIEFINNENYAAAGDILKELVKEEPQNQEVHYCLGQVYDKLSGDIIKSPAVKRDFVLKADKHLRKVLEISATYNGIIFVQGPYSKLTSTWGSLAYSYAYHGYPDSTKWALEMGKKSEGFYDGILEYNKNVLNSCLPNSILFTNGDADTFPIWYLQSIEGYRKDVTLINCSLLNLPEYIIQIKNRPLFSKNTITIKLSNSEINDIKYIKSRYREMSLALPDSFLLFNNPELIGQYEITDSSILKNGKINWTFNSKLEYNGNFYLRIQDQIMSEIIFDNEWERPIHFAATCSEDNKLDLQQYLRNDALVYTLIPQKQYQDQMLLNDEYYEKLLNKYSFNWKTQDDVKLIPEFKNILNNYRNTIIRFVIFRLENGEKEKARGLLQFHEKEYPQDLLPMDLGLKYEICRLYYEADDKEKFLEISEAVEEEALEVMRRNPEDVGSYYNPYRLLLDIYELKSENEKILELYEKIGEMYPDDENINSKIKEYKEKLRNQ